jgi:hypothetical protein
MFHFGPAFPKEYLCSYQHKKKLPLWEFFLYDHMTQICHSSETPSNIVTIYQIKQNKKDDSEFFKNGRINEKLVTGSRV